MNEGKEVALNLKMEIKFCHVYLKRQRKHDDTSTTNSNMAEMNEAGHSTEEAYFRKTVLYALIDSVVTGLSIRFNAVKKLAEIFYLWVEIFHNV